MKIAFVLAAAAALLAFRADKVKIGFVPTLTTRAGVIGFVTTLTTPAGVIGFDMVKALFRSHHAGSWGSGATLMRKTELAASPGWSANHIKERDRK